jgi:hypothetical protein
VKRLALVMLLTSASAHADLASGAPPVPRGFVRLESFGIDAPVPAEYPLEIGELANIDWDGPRGRCKMQISIAHGDEGDRRLVGTLPIRCNVFGEDCGKPCDGLRAVRGGPASEPYPTEPPRVEIDSAFGDRSSDQSGVLLFSDGTVQFHGATCRGYRGRRGKVPAARVAALVDALTKTGVFDHHPPRERPTRGECEHAITHVYLRSATLRNTLSFNCDPDEKTRAVLSLIKQVSGPNPCMR